MKDENTQPTSATDNTPPTPPPLPAQPDSSSGESEAQQKTAQDKMVTMSADDLSRLLAEAEERGYNRAAISPPPDEATETGLYEEPDALRPMPPGWKTSPLMASRRGSIWDR